MIRSAFAAYSPEQSTPSVAQLPGVPTLKPVAAGLLAARPKVRADIADLPDRHAELTMAISISDWRVLFSAVTDRLQAFAGGELVKSPGAHEEATSQFEILAIDCALALESLRKILKPGLQGTATAAPKFG